MNQKISILKNKIEEADPIIVGGASGMSAAADLEFYKQREECFEQVAGVV